MAINHWTYTVNTTGKTAAMYMQHWWHFADGKIVFFRGSEDTEQSAKTFSQRGYRQNPQVDRARCERITGGF